VWSSTRSAAKEPIAHRRKDIMTSIVARISMLAMGLAAIAAIAAPSALAVPRSSWSTNHPLYVHATVPAQTVYSHPVPPPKDDHSYPGLRTAAPTPVSGGTAFSWSAAAIGALTAAIACAVVIGLTLDVRRRRHPTLA
jgi:hypothetical protein